MPDVVDEADLISAQMVEVRVLAIRQKLRVPEHGTEDCEACGLPIDAARRKAMPGARQCVYCQDAEEQRSKHFLR